jgi:phosphate uptake regulator
MEIRNVQRTGNMHYVYMPTSWCKKNKIDSNSKVFLDQKSDGSLVISSDKKEIEQKHLELKIDEQDSEILHRLIVASYINPLKSFKITLNKELNMAKILDQKKLISIESVELDGKTITCESNILISDPEAVLKTMVNKVKNLLIIIKDNYNKELIERYEEEIDRSKLLIDKAVIGFFTGNQIFKQKPIELHYISILSKDIERMVDHIIQLDQKEKVFLEEIYKVIQILKNILDNTSELDEIKAIFLTKNVLKIKKEKVGNLNSYLKRRVRQYLLNISEVILDFAITKKLED